MVGTRIDQRRLEVAPAAARIQQIGQAGGAAPVRQFDALHRLACGVGLQSLIVAAALCGGLRAGLQLVQLGACFALQYLQLQRGAVTVGFGTLDRAPCT